MQFGLSREEFMRSQILEAVGNTEESGIMLEFKQKNKMYLMIL